MYNAIMGIKKKKKKKRSKKRTQTTPATTYFLFIRTKAATTLIQFVKNKIINSIWIIIWKYVYLFIF